MNYVCSTLVLQTSQSLENEMRFKLHSKEWRELHDRWRIPLTSSQIVNSWKYWMSSSWLAQAASGRIITAALVFCIPSRRVWQWQANRLICATIIIVRALCCAPRCSALDKIHPPDFSQLFHFKLTLFVLALRRILCWLLQAWKNNTISETMAVTAVRRCNFGRSPCR